MAVVCARYSVSAQLAESPDRASASPPAQLVSTYCVSCHNARARTGGLTLDDPALANVSAHADVWEKVIRKLRAGMMPPPGLPQPDDATRRDVVAWLESTRID